MDCNMVSSPLWDWEHLIMPNLSKTESDKKQPSDWDIENGEGIESVFPCFAASTTTTTGFLHTPVSKSSQLTSTNSSSPKVTSSPGDFDQVKALEVPAESEDLCLKLGKRSYSDEEFWGGRTNNNTDISAVSVNLSTRKKSKSKSSCGQSMQVPRCQIDGCQLDLSSAKDYHRKHRVCENHSKCPLVTVGGMERRFCQQCSRLHAVSEFDEKKRSCRKRLSHHNARRRKPQGVFPLHAQRVYNPRQHTRSQEKYGWGTTYDTKTESGFTLNFQRGNGAEEHMFASSNLSFSGGFSAGKSNFLQLPGKGVGEYSGGLHETQDFYSALSLLSTDSHGGTKHHPMVESQPIHGTFPYSFHMN